MCWPNSGGEIDLFFRLRSDCQDDRSLAAQPFSDRDGTGGGLCSGNPIQRGQRLHPALLPARCAELLAGTTVKASTTIGFPHGGHTTAIKLAEARQALKDGGQELDAVINISKARSGDWQYVQDELAALTSCTHAGGAKIKVIFENAYLDDAAKIRLCEICGGDWRRLGQDLDRLCAQRSDSCRSRTDAQALSGQGSGKGSGRHSRSRHSAGCSRHRRQPRGSHAHRRPSWRNAGSGSALDPIA